MVSVSFVCVLRFFVVIERFISLLGLRFNSGLRRLGRYEVRVMVGNSVFRYNLFCSFDVFFSVVGL